VGVSRLWFPVPSRPVCVLRSVRRILCPPPPSTLFPYTTLFRSVNKKAIAAFQHQLTPIICVGETLEQREANETMNHIETQVKEADRKSTRLNSSHVSISYAVFCSKQKTQGPREASRRQSANVYQ